MKLSKAVQTLAKALKKDEDLYFGYQSNIAMAFFDEAGRNKLYSSKLLHISNVAAQNFLNLFISQAK